MRLYTGEKLSIPLFCYEETLQLYRCILAKEGKGEEWYMMDRQLALRLAVLLVEEEIHKNQMTLGTVARAMAKTDIWAKARGVRDTEFISLHFHSFLPQQKKVLYNRVVRK